MKNPLPLVGLAAVLSLASFQTPTESQARTVEPVPSSIAWYGTWERGLNEAKRTGLPILLMSAAPRCHDVPGLW